MKLDLNEREDELHTAVTEITKTKSRLEEETTRRREVENNSKKHCNLRFN